MTIPFASQFTQTLPPLLNQLGVSLLISTYQAGQLIILRSRGEGLNTHFCAMEKPMGLAVSADKNPFNLRYEVYASRTFPNALSTDRASGSIYDR